MQFELKMETDLSTALPKSIKFNFEELKKQLSDGLDYYNSLVVTEDSIKGAKKDKAQLNKLKTALENARKDVKNQCLTPYEEFAKQEKELVDMIDAPIQSISDQMQKFDDAKKQEKQDQIKAFYLANIHDLESLLPLEKIWNPKWLNATYKTADISDEITKTIFKIKNGINIIKAFGVDCEQQMLDKYLDTLDMSAAMAEKTRWEEQQKKIKEYEEAQRKAKEEEERKAAEKAKAQAIVINGTPGHDLCDAKPGDDVVFGGNVETAENNYIPEPEQCVPIKPLTKTISVTFEDTTADFRHEMHDLCVKYGIKYGWAK
jgi:hypothetical protein